MTKDPRFYALVIILLSFFLFAYKLPSSFVFADDFTRDLNDILDITRGKLTLLGPALSFGGLRAGPYYYYLLAPIFFISRANVNTILYLNAGLFAASLGYLFYKLSQKTPVLRALLATGVMALVPVYLYGARNPSNGFSYLPLLLIFLTIITFKRTFSTFGLFSLGVLAGVAANFHFVTLPLFFLLFLAIFFQIRDKKKIIFLAVGFGLTFLPLVLFEARHGFVMLKTTLSLKSAWMENRNLRDLPDSVLPDKHIPNNFFIVTSQAKGWLAISPVIIFILGGLTIFTAKKRNMAMVLFIASFLSFFLLAVLMRYQFSPHYLVPYSLALFFTFIVLAARSRWWFVLPLMILFEVFFFPKQLYLASNSTPERFEKAVDLAIAEHLVDKPTPFNVLRLVDRTNKVTLGYEYRYFFKLKGFSPNSIYDYSSAKTLLIFSDLKEVDLEYLGSWEIDQFGRKYMNGANVSKLGELTIYKITK